MIEEIAASEESTLGNQDITEMDTSWSKKYFPGLTEPQHQANDDWFKDSLRLLKDTGILAVPVLQKIFNKEGKEV